MTLAEDGRVTVYKKGDKHHLHIINATESDAGTYKMIIQGMNVEADFEVSSWKVGMLKLAIFVVLGSKFSVSWKSNQNLNFSS